MPGGDGSFEVAIAVTGDGDGSASGTREDQNQLIDRPVRFQDNCLKNFFPTKWHRDHQIVYVKADLLNVAGRVPGGVTI